MTPSFIPLCFVESQLAYEVFKLDELRAVADLSPRDQEIAKYFDGIRTVSEVCKAARVSMTRALATTTLLFDQGYIIPVCDEEESSDFSSLEEAFFASEVEAIDECDEPFVTPSQKILDFLFKLKLRLSDSLHTPRPVPATDSN
jgi:hypothetical protein